MQLDDWLMILGQAAFTTYTGLLFAGINAGIGRHNAAIRDNRTRVLALKWRSISIGIRILAMMFIKLSIGVFLLRISVRPVYTWVLRASILAVAVYGTVLFF
ncbi:hypothetical protein N3K66_006640 [Trichothecium roseum]|uniref:Uncharacterized protein n=1 Tax=Trichothecium roseum TaxID=47278 RepID=A0ACC0UVV4_9HYPO|nr:hypothetical protein N3K66_006640 [Trichothecium roseum]